MNEYLNSNLPAERHSRGDGRSQTVYQPALWEKICVVTTALLVVLLVGFLVVRNLPFRNLFSPSVLPGPSEPANGHHDVNKSPSHPAPARSILAGYIVDAETREPLANVIVAIQDWDTVENKPPTTSTDAEGRFRFDNLRPSPDPTRQVRLIAHKAGYEPSYTDPPLGTTDHPIKLRSAATSGGNP